MDERGFRKATAVFNRDHCLRVLRYLSSGEWRIASEVSRALDIHTSTVSNLLTPMYELGFLQRRLRKSHTRSTFEYRMPASRIALELDFKGKNGATEEGVSYLVACIENVFARLERLGWPGIVERMEAYLGTSREQLDTVFASRLLKEGGRGLREAFAGIERDLTRIASESIGRTAAARLFDLAAEDAHKGREEIVSRHLLRPSGGGS